MRVVFSSCKKSHPFLYKVIFAAMILQRAFVRTKEMPEAHAYTRVIRHAAERHVFLFSHILCVVLNKLEYKVYAAIYGLRYATSRYIYNLVR